MTFNVGFRVVHSATMPLSRALPPLPPLSARAARNSRADRNFLNFTSAPKAARGGALHGNPRFSNRNFLNFTPNQMVVSK